MSDEKSKVTDKASEIAKHIWLAGLGAYGKAVEDAQGRLERAMEPPKLFKDLVKAGSALEDDAREALGNTASARQSVEDRIARVRDNFYMQRPARVEDLAALQKKIDQLNRKVDALNRALQQQGIAVTPARGGAKAAPKKKGAVKKSPGAGRTAAKKSPAGKKKSPARKGATGKKGAPRGTTGKGSTKD
ncbi:MAG: phasin family protein [Halioglobus sp.]|nr:phasin family protein [Halioglobus sp.]